MVDNFTFANLSADAILAKVTDAGISKIDAATIVGTWLIGQSGTQSRMFAYSAPLAPDDPDCQPTFARSFHHVDWIDGESVVQAGQTVGEDGFNERLHRIETDLDALAADSQKLFACVSEIRASVVQMFSEIKLELNRVDADLAARRAPTNGGVFNDFTHFDTVAEAPKFTGSGVLGDQKVQIWQTKQGVMALPWVAGAGGIDPIINPAATKAPQLGELLATRPDVAALVTAGTTVGELVSKFGSVRSPDGTPLSDLVSTLPATQQLTTTDGLITVLTQHDVLTAVATGAGSAVLDATLGSSEVLADPSSVSVAALPTLTSGEKFALANAGITTVGQLSAAGSVKVQKALNDAGLAVSAGRGAAVVTGINVATGLSGLMFGHTG